MNRLLKISGFLFLMLPLLSAQGDEQAGVASPQTLAEKLNQIMEGFPSTAVSSVMVSDADTGKVIYQKQPYQNVMPASTQKILTAIADYAVLGPTFRYATHLLSREPADTSGAIKGGVQIVFSGDPSLTRGDVKALIQGLARQGIKSIDGTIWLNGSIYGGYAHAEGVGWDDLKICFAAPSTAMVLDKNCFRARLHPADKVGEKPTISYAQPDWPFRLENDVRTVPANEQAHQPKSWESIYAQYRLTGSIAKGSEPLNMAFAVKQPEQAVKAFIESSLKQAGIIHHGKTMIGKPAIVFHHELVEHKSKPLADLLAFMLITSNNLYADNMLKTLGHKKSQQPGDYENGVKALMQSLKELGVDLGSSHLQDGSGLSRYNLLSASTLNSALLIAWKKWGRDTPWLKGKQQDYWLKTGKMKDIRGLAGYAFPKGASPKIFVVLLNGLAPSDDSSSKDTQRFWQSMKTQEQVFIQTLTNK